MEKSDRILNIIKSIRESAGPAIAIYTYGNCYQFYEILKFIFTNAEAFYDYNHVWTKIDNKYYDIRGEANLEDRILIPINEELKISLSKNKWSDERRAAYTEEYRKEIRNRKMAL